MLCYIRDVSKYMKEHNILGSSKGYIQRVVDSYSAVTLDKVRKYFLSTLKFCHLYLEGETGYSVNQKMRDLRKMKKCHRGAAEPDAERTKKPYNRDRMESED